MRFTQSITTIEFFKDNFLKRWELDEYHNENEPVIFFGIHGKDSEYERHKTYKIIIPTVPSDVPDFKKLKNNEKTILILDREKYPNYYIPENVIVKKEVIEIKDYSLFKPNTLGDKIYYYSGFKNGWGGHWGKDIINEIQKNIDYEIITTTHNNITDYDSIESLKENFYDKSFLNLNLSELNGMTTVREMGLMGRKTITMRKNNYYDYNCIINCKSIDDIIFNIKEESKKIGTLQDGINSHTVGDEWLNVNYWINENR